MGVNQRTITSERLTVVVVGIWSLLSLCWTSWAGESLVSKSRVSTCGVIENVEGVVEVLSPDRKTLIPVHERSDLECGSWVSTAQGWIRIRHGQGYQVQVGPESFLKISNQTQGEDQITVFKGGLFAKASSGQGELRVTTTNGRARIKNSSAILVYEEQDALTQLIAVEGRPSLENRFEDQAKITIKPGEVTSFHANLKRISPSTPKGASVASLKPKLQALHVDESLISRAIKVTNTRVNRRFASVSEEGHPDSHQDSSEHKKKTKTKEFKSDYSRYPASQRSDEDEYLARRWREKTLIFEKKKIEVLKELSDVHLDE